MAYVPIFFGCIVQYTSSAPARVTFVIRKPRELLAMRVPIFSTSPGLTTGQYRRSLHRSSTGTLSLVSACVYSTTESSTVRVANWRPQLLLVMATYKCTLPVSMSVCLHTTHQTLYNAMECLASHGASPSANKRLRAKAVIALLQASLCPYIHASVVRRSPIGLHPSKLPGTCTGYTLSSPGHRPPSLPPTASSIQLFCFWMRLALFFR